MMMPDDDATALEETPSDEQNPDETETPSADEEEAEQEPAEEAADETETEEDEEAPPQGDPAVVNLEKKFAHIKDPEQRRIAVAKAYWEKTNFASRTRRELQARERENADLKRRLAEIDSQTKATPKEPPPPAPEVAELDKRIQALYQEDEGVRKDADAQLNQLSEVDVEIAKIQARMEDAKAAGDDDKAARFELMLDNKNIKRDAIIRRYQDCQRRRQSISYDYERLNNDRKWLAKVLEERATRQETEERELEAFKSEFPEKVDTLIEAAATRLGIPDHLTDDLLQEVNDGLLVDLWRLGEADLDEVDVPELVQARVERFMKARDLAARSRFKERSAAKARVTTPTGKPAAPSTPARSTKPVTPASIQAVELGPKMRKAREYLISKGY